MFTILLRRANERLILPLSIQAEADVVEVGVGVGVVDAVAAGVVEEGEEEDAVSLLPHRRDVMHAH